MPLLRKRSCFIYQSNFSFRNQETVNSDVSPHCRIFGGILYILINSKYTQITFLCFEKPEIIIFLMFRDYQGFYDLINIRTQLLFPYMRSFQSLLNVSINLSQLTGCPDSLKSPKFSSGHIHIK